MANPNTTISLESPKKKNTGGSIPGEAFLTKNTYLLPSENTKSIEPKEKENTCQKRNLLNHNFESEDIIAKKNKFLKNLEEILKKKYDIYLPCIILLKKKTDDIDNLVKITEEYYPGFMMLNNQYSIITNDKIKPLEKNLYLIAKYLINNQEDDTLFNIESQPLYHTDYDSFFNNDKKNIVIKLIIINKKKDAPSPFDVITYKIPKKYLIELKKENITTIKKINSLIYKLSTPTYMDRIEQKNLLSLYIKPNSLKYAVNTNTKKYFTDLIMKMNVPHSSIQIILSYVIKNTPKEEIKNKEDLLKTDILEAKYDFDIAEYQTEDLLNELKFIEKGLTKETINYLKKAIKKTKIKKKKAEFFLKKAYLFLDNLNNNPQFWTENTKVLFWDSYGPGRYKQYKEIE